MGAVARLPEVLRNGYAVLGLPGESQSHEQVPHKYRPNTERAIRKLCTFLLVKLSREEEKSSLSRCILQKLISALQVMSGELVKVLAS